MSRRTASRPPATRLAPRYVLGIVAHPNVTEAEGKSADQLPSVAGDFRWKAMTSIQCLHAPVLDPAREPHISSSRPRRCHRVGLCGRAFLGRDCDRGHPVGNHKPAAVGTVVSYRWRDRSSMVS